MRPLLAMVLAPLLACGSDRSDSHAPSQHGPLLDSLETSSVDRVVVAEVNGQPVYDDCVARQAIAHDLEREAALQECIDFELLAQAANQPDYLKAPPVQEEGKQELVRNFLKARYYLQGPADFDDDILKAYWENVKLRRYNHPALRNLVYCGTKPTKDMEPESPQHQKSKKFFETLYSELKDRSDLQKEDLFTICHDRHEEFGVTNHKLFTFRLSSREGIEEAWRAPLFDGPERAGQVVPPFFSNQGWILALITEAKAARTTTYEEAEPEMRETLYTSPVYQPQRDQAFDKWFASIEAGHSIKRYPERIPTTTTVLPPAELELPQ